MKQNSKFKVYKGIQVKKRLGQHFLQDEDALHSIGNIILQAKAARIIEIGVGTGELTDYYRHDCTDIHLIEIDKDMITLLNKKYDQVPSIKLHQADATKFDYSCLLKGDIDTLVTGNLPYGSAIQILKRLVRYRHLFSSLVVMLQNEVAHKLIADHGSKAFASISVFFQYYFDSHLNLKINRASFYPVPKIDSAVMTMVPHFRFNLPPEVERSFQKLVHAAFLQRRKKIINSLGLSRLINVSKERLEDQFRLAGINPELRAEEIPTVKYVDLAVSLHQCMTGPGD